MEFTQLLILVVVASQLGSGSQGTLGRVDGTSGKDDREGRHRDSFVGGGLPTA